MVEDGRNRTSRPWGSGLQPDGKPLALIGILRMESNGAGGEIRTHDLLLTRQLLYPN